MAIFKIEKRYEIGIIEFDDIFLHKFKVDNKNNPTFKNSFKGKCSVEIYNNEGSNMPHFHINSLDKSFQCCICLFDNRFFDHGKHTDLLHKKDWKILDEWMRQKNKSYSDLTNWERAKTLWDIVNSTNYLNNDIKLDYNNQPDYTIIKPYKEK